MKSNTTFLYFPNGVIYYHSSSMILYIAQILPIIIPLMFLL